MSIQCDELYWNCTSCSLSHPTLLAQVVGAFSCTYTQLLHQQQTSPKSSRYLSHVVKDSPQPHDPFEFGFKNMNSLLQSKSDVSFYRAVVVSGSYTALQVLT